MKSTILGLVVAASVAAAAAGVSGFSPRGAAGTPAQPGAARVPVLVELFTSEGCSSCPPADDLLARMIKEQPIPGVEIIGLSLHVDYWNQGGWRDPFSSFKYSARQNEYAAAWRTDNIFTPQAVVDGAHQVIGSDWAKARELIGQAAATPKLAVTVDLPAGAAPNGKAPVRVDVALPATSGAGTAAAAVTKADVLLVVTQDGLVTNVERGENANRRLSHAAVVRSLEKIGKFDGQHAFSATPQISLDKAWPREALSVVAIVQDSASRKILGVASRRF